MIVRTLTVVAAAMLALSPISAQAASCEQLKAAIIEGAAMDQTPTPTFKSDEHLHDLQTDDAGVQYLEITAFDNVDAVMGCWQGSVRTFGAMADDGETMPSVHMMLVMGWGLHGYGLEWKPALELRDRLVKMAQADDRHTAKLPVNGGKVSLVVSGSVTFQIDADH